MVDFSSKYPAACGGVLFDQSLAAKYVKLFLKPDTPLLPAGRLHC